jgi:UDP-3-O-[3-hydroxymyristoyl] N-acetylglucosamine deacetylase
MNMDHFQNTIATIGRCSGIGVHSGEKVNLVVRPAPINHGIKFCRVDLPNQPCVPARFNRVVDTSLATVLGSDGFIISTIEHLMAALSGLGIDNALIEVDSYELPIMDGSAAPFVSMIKAAGIAAQTAPRCYFEICEPVEMEDNNKFVGIYPASDFRISCTIEFNHPLIQTQQHCAVITAAHFEHEIASARTFGFVHEQQYMKQFGLGKGASLDNVVAIDEKGVLNKEGLRYADEFVRHKLLDCIGDFSLLGLPILGHIVAKRSGHQFHHTFLEKLFQEKNAWQTCTIENNGGATRTPFKQAAN